jgi:hypothetical protein
LQIYVSLKEKKKVLKLKEEGPRPKSSEKAKNAKMIGATRKFRILKIKGSM